MERYMVSKDWMTLALIAIILLIVIIKLLYPQRFEDFSKLFSTNRYFNLRQKSYTLTDSFNLLFYGVNILSFSLLAYLSLTQFFFFETANQYIVFVQIALGYSVFFITKYFLEKITADVFGIEKMMDRYLYYKISFRNFMALLLVPISVLFLYGFQLSKTGIIFVLSLIGLANLTILLNFYKKHQKYILPQWFYFILYLCAFEIAPYFILYKVFINTEILS